MNPRILAVFSTSRRTAIIPLFFYSLRCRRSSIPAAEKQLLADNFLQKQQKQLASPKFEWPRLFKPCANQAVADAAGHKQIIMAASVHDTGAARRGTARAPEQIT